jgi:hydroxyacylglutathione hydrolase
MRDGAVVVDARSSEAFAGGHIPGALNVGLSNSFSTWAGTVLEPGDRVLLVLENPDQLWEATWQLLRTGYDLPIGWLSGGMQDWRSSGAGVEVTEEIAVRRLRALMDDSDITVLDVRQPAEWTDGHIPGAKFITGAEIPERLAEIDTKKTVAVVCGTGYRSSVISSFLRARGDSDAHSVIGGMSAWRNADLPVETD